MNKTLPLYHTHYLRDTRQCVGYCVLFWRKGGGYTCHIDQAQEFTKEQAFRQHKERRSDVPILMTVAYQHATLQLDAQNLPGRKTKRKPNG